MHANIKFLYARTQGIDDIIHHGSRAAKLREFAPPKSTIQRRSSRLAMWKKTQDDTKYCMGIWNEWRQHKQLYDGSTIPAVDELDSAALAKLLSHFALVVRKRMEMNLLPILFFTPYLWNTTPRHEWKTSYWLLQWSDYLRRRNEVDRSCIAGDRDYSETSEQRTLRGQQSCPL